MGDWWTPLILRDLGLGLTRFDDLAEDLGISRNLLTARLKNMVAAGLVGRRRYSDRPPRFEYFLEQPALELLPILMALTAWGDRFRSPSKGQPLAFVHRACGKTTIPRVTCSECGSPLHANEVEPRRGPGAAAKPGTKIIGARLEARSPRTKLGLASC